MDYLTYRWTTIVLIFYTTYISLDLAHHEIFRAKVGKCGINKISKEQSGQNLFILILSVLLQSYRIPILFYMKAPVLNVQKKFINAIYKKIVHILQLNIATEFSKHLS